MRPEPVDGAFDRPQAAVDFPEPIDPMLATLKKPTSSAARTAGRSR